MSAERIRVRRRGYPREIRRGWTVGIRAPHRFPGPVVPPLVKWNVTRRSARWLWLERSNA